MQRLLILTFTALLSLLPLRAEEAYSLFDGSFTGWEGDTKGTWRIENGTFTAGSVERNQPRNEFLSTKKEFGDFELTVKWKLIGTEGFVNGGVQFRTKRIPDNHEVSGYQADLGAGYDGALYDESRRNKMLAKPAPEVLEKARKPLGEWNDYRIRAEGPRIQIWLNGVQTVDYTEEDASIPRTGIIAVQIHGDAKSQVWYKDLIMTELGETPKPAPTGPTARFADDYPVPPREAFTDGKFAIRAGEVIVFTGGTNMVRLMENGRLEASLALAAKEHKPRIRSMAWEGDTVYEQWRDQNFGSWREQLDAVKATCVFLWFGQMEALDDTHTDEQFASAFTALLEEFKAVTPRLVVMTPVEFDAHGWPDPIAGLPDNSSRNERILRFGRLMKMIAEERGALVLDCPALEHSHEGEGPFERTSNGVHLTDQAIRTVFAPMLTLALAYPEQTPGSDLLHEIRSKNQAWHDCWKAMNWAFAYSDRTQQPFGKGINQHPPLAVELGRYKSLLRTADDRIHRAAAGEAQTAPEPQPQPAAHPTLPPEEELASFTMRPGFEANLFASERDGVVKPLSMRWDVRGRLWVACSPSYPQLVPGEPRRDYIMICEDTDEDGRADKFTKFIDGLTMPMGIEFSETGVYICESTQLIHIARDENDKPGERRVILSGFGTGDSHQMINSIRWGPDGCLWFTQGLHIFSRIETPRGIVRFDRAGLWRFHPRTWLLQGFFGNAAAGANCWGVTFDNWGQVFHCAADNTPGFYTTPGLGALSTPPPYYNIGALAVSPVKGMCLEFISSSHLPPELNNTLCKPVYFGNQVLLYKLVEDGSGFITEDLGPLMSSSQTAFRPLGVQTGPDGALYVCDWYNPVIGHYQASYRDPNRDKTHGRIWRVKAKDRPLAPKPENLHTLSVDGLVEQMKSPERWVRDQAKHRLYDLYHPEEAVKRVTEEMQKPDATPEFAMEALGMLASNGAFTQQVLEDLPRSGHAGLNALTARAAGQIWASERMEDKSAPQRAAMILLARRLRDAVSSRVRMEWITAAGFLDTPLALAPLCEAMEHPRDRFIDYAFANAVKALKPQWSSALADGKLALMKPEHLAMLLQADGSAGNPASLRKILSEPSISDGARTQFRALLISTGAPEDLTFALQQGPMGPTVAVALSAAARDVKPSEDFAASLETWWNAASTDLSGNEMKIAIASTGARWGLDQWAQRLREMTDSDQEFVAIMAIGEWADLKGRDSIADLKRLAGDARSGVSSTAIASLLRLDPASGVPAAAQHLRLHAGDRAAVDPSSSLTAGEAVSMDLIRALYSVPDGPGLLTAEFRREPPPAAAALAILQALATAGHTAPELTAVLRTAAGLPENGSIVPDYSAEFVTKIVSDAKASGDAARGGEVFRAAQSACMGCHKVGDAGGITGPNLTSVGRGMTPELIVESVLWPKRQIKEGYFLTSVTMKDGRSLSGYRQVETDTDLSLIPAGGAAAETVKKADIQTRSDTGTLMPDGLTTWMTDQQRLDLLRYLFDLGR